MQYKLFTDADIGYKPLQLLSYGAGKQTFAILVLIEQERLPKPDLVIFADTGNESEETYRHIENVAKPLMARLGLEFVTITRGELYKYCWEQEITPMWPSCTTMFKVRVINNYVFNRYNFKPGVHQCDTWIGITTDEAHRNTASQVQYIVKTFPLLDLGLSRQDCIDLTTFAAYPVPPKSGCVMCPHKNWEAMIWADPDKFEYALNLERHAQTRRLSLKRSASLPEYGRTLRQIKALPNEKYRQAGGATEQDACSTGYCGV